jgi:hypothetical protein
MSHFPEVVYQGIGAPAPVIILVIQSVKIQAGIAYEYEIAYRAPAEGEIAPQPD